MTVGELIGELQKYSPKSEVNLYFRRDMHPDVEYLMYNGDDYYLFEITEASGWGNPGADDDLTVISIGQCLGNG